MDTGMSTSPTRHQWLGPNSGRGGHESNPLHGMKKVSDQQEAQGFIARASDSGVDRARRVGAMGLAIHHPRIRQESHLMPGSTNGTGLMDTPHPRKQEGTCRTSLVEMDVGACRNVPCFLTKTHAWTHTRQHNCMYPHVCINVRRQGLWERVYAEGRRIDARRDREWRRSGF